MKNHFNTSEADFFLLYFYHQWISLNESYFDSSIAIEQINEGNKKKRTTTATTSLKHWIFSSHVGLPNVIDRLTDFEYK